MIAVTREQYGAPDALTVKDLPIREPSDGEVLIKVKACTVNRTDGAILTGTPLIMRAFTGIFKPKLKITGTDFAGIVEKVGSDVKQFEVGDRVWGFDDQGLQSHAEYLVISQEAPISLMPGNTPFNDAAASLEGAHYAYNMIRKSGLTAEHAKVMVYGATGAIGSAAIQLLKTMNLNTTAVCNSKNVDLIASLGADYVIDYQTEDFTATDERFDFIFDTVGKTSFAACKPILKPKGVYISTELGQNAQNIWLSFLTPLLGKKKVLFPVPTDISGTLTKMNDLLTNGQFKPVIEKTYPLAETRAAFEYVMSGQKTGNVVLTQ